MANKKVNPKELRYIRKVTLVSEQDIELVPNINEVLTNARDVAVKAAKSNQLETYSKEDSRFINAVQKNALTNSELGKTK